MEELITEADALQSALRDALDRAETLRDAAEHIGADDCSSYAEEAVGSLERAIDSLEGIRYEG